MRNYVQRGDTLPLTALADTLSGDVVIVGEFIGVANHDAAEGDPVETDVVGVFQLAKAAGAIEQGAKVYWKASERNAVTTAQGNTLLGIATEPAATADTDVRVRLIG